MKLFTDARACAFARRAEGVGIAGQRGIGVSSHRNSPAAIRGTNSAGRSPAQFAVRGRNGFRRPVIIPTAGSKLPHTTERCQGTALQTATRTVEVFVKVKNSSKISSTGLRVRVDRFSACCFHENFWSQSPIETNGPSASCEKVVSSVGGWVFPNLFTGFNYVIQTGEARYFRLIVLSPTKTDALLR